MRPLTLVFEGSASKPTSDRLWFVATSITWQPNGGITEADILPTAYATPQEAIEVAEKLPSASGVIELITDAHAFRFVKEKIKL